MGGELSRRGIGKSDGTWSAHALIEHPDLVATVHDEYIEAGARVITTNTYSTIPSYLGKEGLEDRYLELTELACQLARRVADESSHDVRVAGSLPPLETSYRPDLVPSDEASRPIYEALVKVMSPYVDLFLCETMSCAREGRNAVSAARKVAGDSKPVWVAWTLADEPGGGLRSGESVVEAHQAVAEFEPDAFLFNCSDPRSIGVALTELRELTDKPLGAYPNRFHIPEGWTLDNDVPAERFEMSEEDFLGFASEWRATGASIIGGCCHVGPNLIEALANSVLETPA